MRLPAAAAMLMTRAGAEVIGLGLTAFVAIWLSRTVGPEGLGYWAVTQTILRFGSGLIGAGFPTVGSQRVAHRTESPATAWSTVTTVRLVLAAAAVLLLEIAVVISPFGDPNIRLLIGLTAPGMLFVAVSSEWLLVAAGRVHAVALSRVAGAVAAAGSALLLVHGPDDLPATAVVLMAPLAVAAIVSNASTFAVLIRWQSLRIPRRSQVASYRHDAGHYFWADLSVLTYSSVDRIFLYIIATPAIVGLYEAAYKLVQPFAAIAAVVSDSMFLRLAQALGQAKREAATLRVFIDLMFMATVPIGFFLTLYSAPIVAIVYGEAFEESAQYLALLGWSTTIGFLAAALAMPLPAWRRPREYANAQLTGTGVSIAANLLLVPILLAAGSAIAAMISRASIAAVAYTGFRRATSYPVLLDFLAYLGISGVAFVAALLTTFALDLTAFPSAAVFLMTYFSIGTAVRWKGHLPSPRSATGTIRPDDTGPSSAPPVETGRDGFSR